MRTFYKVLSALAAIFILATMLSVTSYAKEESATELYERDPDAFYDKYMCVDEEAKEQGLYSDANKSQNKKTGGSSSSSSNQSGSSGGGKGIVYDCDELHVVGCPTDEDGYTKAGDYGNID